MMDCSNHPELIKEIQENRTRIIELERKISQIVKDL